MAGYLESLTGRLAQGAASLSSGLRERHRRFVLAARQGDGGFAGRDGGSDLYYTGFALRSLAVLGALHGDEARQAGAFLAARLTGRESIIDLLSLLYGGTLLRMAADCDIFGAAPPQWPHAVAGALEQLRRGDGGYAKGPEGQASSTYHTFLVLVCLELIGQPVPRREQLVGFLLSQRCPDGGFREIRASQRAGTNPTAAAVAALRILNAIDASVRESTIEFLSDMQNEEGGMRANTRIPIADLLSTFTGLVTLTDLDARRAIDCDSLARYVRSLESEDGGFHGAAWDPARDVEYTFYGVGCLSLLEQSG